MTPADAHNGFDHYPELLMLWGVAGLTVPLLHRLRISPVLGFLICGLAAGPYGLGQFFSWFPSFGHSALIASFAELGVVMLMFMIGLKLSLKELWQMRRDIVGLGGLQILLTGCAVFAAAQAFDHNVELSILLGACFAQSSTAIVMQMLEENNMAHTPVGRLSFSILLMQDLAVVPILALLSAFAARGDAPLWLVTGKALGLAAAAIAVIYVAGQRLLPPLLALASPARRREWLAAFALFIVVAAAMATQRAGLSSALGAFLAGLLLAETAHRGEIEQMVAPVKNLLMGVFFLSVGMMINLQDVAGNLFWILAAVAGIGAIKAGVLYALARLFGVARAAAFETAVLLGQGGEFVFVIMALALAENIVTPANAHYFMIVTAVSMLLTPLVAQAVWRWQARMAVRAGA